MDLGPINRDETIISSAEVARIRKDMNLIRGTRVGWEDKNKYRDRLIEMYTQGHLTEAEYDARMEWVEAARTDDEVRVAFLDLPRLPLTERPKPKKKRKPRTTSEFVREAPMYAGIIAAFEWVVFIVGAVTGQAMPMIVGSVFGVAWTLLAIKRYNDAKGKI